MIHYYIMVSDVTEFSVTTFHQLQQQVRVRICRILMSALKKFDYTLLVGGGGGVECIDKMQKIKVVQSTTDKERKEL